MIGGRHVEAHTRKRLSWQLGPRLKRSNQRCLVSARYCNDFPYIICITGRLARSIGSMSSRFFLSIPAWLVTKFPTADGVPNGTRHTREQV